MMIERATVLMKEMEGILRNCWRFELFSHERSERNLHLYQRLGCKTFKTAKITDQTDIVCSKLIHK